MKQSLSQDSNSPPIRMIFIFMEAEVSFLCSQQPTAGPYFGTDKFTPFNLFKIKFNIILPCMTQVISFLQVSLPKHCKHLSPSLAPVLTVWFPSLSNYIFTFRPNTFSGPCSWTPLAFVIHLMWDTKFHIHILQQATLQFAIL